MTNFREEKILLILLKVRHLSLELPNDSCLSMTVVPHVYLSLASVLGFQHRFWLRDTVFDRKRIDRRFACGRLMNINKVGLHHVSLPPFRDDSSLPSSPNSIVRLRIPVFSSNKSAATLPAGFEDETGKLRRFGLDILVDFNEN